MMCRDIDLNGLLIGTASSSTQIEGGDTNNSWYEWALTPGRVKDGSSPLRANDHWNRWREDNEIMSTLGFPIARLGLEWSRIEPSAGSFSASALDRYRQEIGDLVDRRIRPLVTLHHFSNPLWFERRGQFTNRYSPWVYERYVREVVSALGDLVSEWVTINEPNVHVTQAHLFREGPPGTLRPVGAIKTLRNLALSHLRAFDAIHEMQGDAATVTIAHHMREFTPRNRANPIHRAFTAINRYAFQDIVTDAFGRGVFRPPLGPSPVSPGRYVDVIGLNYYSRTAVSGPADGVFPSVPVTDLGWEVYPRGIANCAAELYGKLGVPVWVTENGTADNGSATEIESFRPRFIIEHLSALATSGVPVERYYHWCFIDNWEWSDGEVPRFGIVHNDYETQTRTIKPSGYMLAEIAKAGVITTDMYDRYAAGMTYRSQS